ncbi:hypothetical protein KAU11_03665, partial [Candidatus Babeliales bacterium]|nr:hypothetical protein [Candidatus Babeliales bacterium]
LIEALRALKQPINTTVGVVAKKGTKVVRNRCQNSSVRSEPTGGERLSKICEIQLSRWRVTSRIM